MKLLYEEREGKKNNTNSSTLPPSSSSSLDTRSSQILGLEEVGQLTNFLDYGRELFQIKKNISLFSSPPLNTNTYKEI